MLMHYNHFYFSFLNKDISASRDNIMMKTSTPILKFYDGGNIISDCPFRPSFLMFVRHGYLSVIYITFFCLFFLKEHF